MNLKPLRQVGRQLRRASFLQRMDAVKGSECKSKGKPTRLLLSLRAWGPSSKADAVRKGQTISNVIKQKGIPLPGHPAKKESDSA